MPDRPRPRKLPLHRQANDHRRRGNPRSLPKPGLRKTGPRHRDLRQVLLNGDLWEPRTVQIRIERERPVRDLFQENPGKRHESRVHPKSAQI